MQSASHVPAWKRLGLQLKRPSDSAPSQLEPPTKKSRLPDSETDAVHKQPQTKVSLNGTSKTNKAVKKVRLSEDQSAVNALKNRRVTLSSSAKNQDGSAEKIHDHAPPVDEYYYTEAAIKERKEAKRRKRELRRQKSGNESEFTSHNDDSQPKAQPPSANTLEKSPSYLVYLDQFSQNRAAWKFNKTHQTKLLNHLFNLKHIPTEYDQAVSNYIEDLQGQAARTRLRETAEQIVKESDDAEPKTGTQTQMEDPDTRADAVKQALDKSKTNLKGILKQAAVDEETRSKQWQIKMARRRRAERVLEALATCDEEFSQPNNATATQSDELEVDQPASAAATKQSLNKIRSRGVKRRTHTGVPDDDEISSDSSSSEGSSEESSEEEESSSEDGGSTDDEGDEADETSPVQNGITE